MKRLFLLFLIFLSSSLPVHAAETVTLNNVDKQDVYNFCVQSFMKGGSTLQSSSDYSMTFRQNVNNNIKFTLNWGAGAYILHNINLVPVGKDVMVSYEIQIVSVGKLGNERIHVASFENAAGYFPGYKEDLERLAWFSTLFERKIKHNFNGLYSIGLRLANKKKKGAVEIEYISPNSIADKAGLKAKDRILSINSNPTKK